MKHPVIEHEMAAYPAVIAEEQVSMTIREVKATGLEALNLATKLLQRARLADTRAGIWEAADVQWAWRTPRKSDNVDKIFWIDGEGPVAGILLTSGTNDDWQCDPVMVPDASGPDASLVWNLALEYAAKHSAKGFDVPVSDNDPVFLELAQQSGLIPGDRDSTAWMNATDRPAIITPIDGFVLTDRVQRLKAPHPMRHRNGEDIAQRLDQCSLYDPELDFAVETTDGRIAGYSLYWFDPVTKVGMIEPVRIEDAFQRKGLARAMLTAGLDRLVSRNARHLKVSYHTDAAGALYHGVGFRKASTTTWYRSVSG